MNNESQSIRSALCWLWPCFHIGKKWSASGDFTMRTEFGIISDAKAAWKKFFSGSTAGPFLPSSLASCPRALVPSFCNKATPFHKEWSKNTHYPLCHLESACAITEQFQVHSVGGAWEHTARTTICLCTVAELKSVFRKLSNFRAKNT